MTWRRSWAWALALAAGLLVAVGVGVLLARDDGKRLVPGSVVQEPGAPSTDQGRDPGGPAPAIEVDDALNREEVRRASRVAIAAVGRGRVLEVDSSDDPGESYEVEVHTAGGGEIDVALDGRFRRVPNAPYDD